MTQNHLRPHAAYAVAASWLAAPTADCSAPESAAAAITTLPSEGTCLTPAEAGQPFTRGNTVLPGVCLTGAAASGRTNPKEH